MTGGGTEPHPAMNIAASARPAAPRSWFFMRIRRGGSGCGFTRLITLRSSSGNRLWPRCAAKHRIHGKRSPEGPAPCTARDPCQWLQDQRSAGARIVGVELAAVPSVVAALAAKYTSPQDRQYLPGHDPAFDVVYAVRPRSAMAWRLDDYAASQRRWTALS